MSRLVVCRLWMKSDGTVVCTKGLDTVIEDAHEIFFTNSGWMVADEED